MADGSPGEVTSLNRAEPRAVPASAAATPPAEALRRPRRRKRLLLLLLGPLLVVAVGLYVYLSGGRYVSTDNAYVQSDMLTVSPEVDGRVAEILVTQNQHVTAGTPLFRLDTESFEIAVREAEAELDRVQQSVAEQRASLGEAQAQLAAAQETLSYAQHEYERQQQLQSRGVSSGTSLEDAAHAVNQARQAAQVASQQIAQIQAALGGSADTPTEDLPDYRAALAAYDAAALNLRRTEVKAPVDGIVTNVDHLQVGEHLDAGAAAFTLVRDDQPWVEANLKETDLAHLQVGQTAEVTVDAYPGTVWHGVVDSISPATGAEFSILPAQNATGNWVKVVQRVPVRLSLDLADGQPPLRAGMSAVVEIDTKQSRSLPGLISSAFGGADGQD